MRRKRRERSDLILNAFLTGLAIVVFAIIMILLASHFHKEEDTGLIARADYLISRSEASLARWDHGRSLYR